MKDTPETDLALEDPSTALSGEMAELTPEMGAEHMHTFRAPPIEGIGGGADDVVQVDEAGQPLEPVDGQEVVEMMTKDAFFVVLRHSFGLPGMFMPDFRPLAIQPEEEPIARDASDAIYELLEIYYPGALMPQGDTFARIARAAPFIFAKVLVVREILRARRMAKMAPPRQEPAGAFKTSRAGEAPPANTDAAPSEADPTAWMQDEVAA